MAPSPNHYQTLEISHSASAVEIKQAFRRLARQYHPDLNPQDAEAVEVFRSIRAAYDVLSDPIQRQYYDEEQGFRPTSTGGQSPSVSSTAPSDSSHSSYLKGIDHEAARNYQAALEEYNQAIERKPDFSSAYLHRAKVRYALAQDRAVLEDCTHLIELQAHLATAYFYQGLARYRLGYGQSALEAFNQAIAQEADHGRAYYQRAIAHLELGDQDDAIADLHRAMECFQAQGDGQYYRRVADKLHDLGIRFTSPIPQQSASPSSTTPKTLHRPNVQWIVPAALGELPGILFNPSANLLPLYGKLGPGRASFIGILWLALSYALGIVAAILRWSADSQQVVWPVAIVVTLAIASFIAGIGLLRMLKGYWEGISQVLFVAGAALLPLGLLCLVMSPRSPDLWPLQLSLITIALSLSILILHSGLIQICNLPESMASFSVPILLLTSGWLAYWTFQTLMPPPLELLDAPSLISHPAFGS